MRRADIIGLALSVVGMIDSAYLSFQSLNEKLPLYCPPGILNCGPVVASQYSRIFGIPVAFLGLVWFVAMFALLTSNKTGILFPLWVTGVAFVLYLISLELFVIHYICPYCTVAHVSCFLMGIPVLSRLKEFLYN